MKTYETAIIDPPWPYQKTSKHEKLTGYSESHYAPLSIADLAALPIGARVNSYIFLWTTSPMMPSALGLIEAWGFEFRTLMYWFKSYDPPVHNGPSVTFKPVYGVGYWVRGDTEPIVVASRKGAPAIRTNERATFITERQQHSAKPDTLHELCEKHFPGPYLELFARRKRKGWVCVGDEIDGRDIRNMRRK